MNLTFSSTAFTSASGCPCKYSSNAGTSPAIARLLRALELPSSSSIASVLVTRPIAPPSPLGFLASPSSSDLSHMSSSPPSADSLGFNGVGSPALPSLHPKLRAISKYLFSASAGRSWYVFPADCHASHFALPAKSNRDGFGTLGVGDTVRYLKMAYSYPEPKHRRQMSGIDRAGWIGWTPNLQLGRV